VLTRGLALSGGRRQEQEAGKKKFFAKFLS